LWFGKPATTSVAYKSIAISFLTGTFKYSMLGPPLYYRKEGEAPYTTTTSHWGKDVASKLSEDGQKGGCLSPSFTSWISAVLTIF